MDIEDLIQGAERVIDVLGCWPSFEGAELISFAVSRSLPAQSEATTATLCVHVRLHHGKAVSAGANAAATHNVLIELVLRDIQHLALYDFNDLNVIDQLDVSRSADGSVAVEIDPDSGAGGAVRCRSVEIGRVASLI
ncbi:Imm50 family immunity protein [Bordetella genomosp. 13]|uniref:Imm50 family immunity protein n=1 Tax=Bordetella genomosp. 13 TaxID=463040 RepID=UPI001642F897|nr:Imm50 family immunity protein [Bordetella genomosp. 13]